MTMRPRRYLLSPRMKRTQGLKKKRGLLPKRRLDVDYLSYLGGGNTSAAASTYFRKCIKMTEDLFSNLTWTGSKKQKLVSLKDSRFSAACEEAMSRHENVFSKPDNMGFSHVMTKAFDEKDMLMIKA
ncbi:hypothetical protein TSAR_004525 [Trichomalopsis sarcophagae]|uniref:Uncharacterized protein n=1 Tax=Trichomalopsis sarcophagae TaxID=543379 RepID=A0A232ED45_9HYME|nr:hypothetical protein TSAR_004525 [Trichomalopsis sarcophagae]